MRARVQDAAAALAPLTALVFALVIESAKRWYL